MFIKAYTSFHNYSYTGKSPLAYFYTIARNTLIDRSRKKRIQTVQISEDDTILEQLPDESARIDEQLMKKEEALVLRHQIELLSEDQQEVILLRFIDGLSTKEIAEVLGKKEPAVRQLQSKGLKSLRNIQKWRLPFLQ